MTHPNRTFLGLGECMVELSPAGPGLLREGFAGDVFNTLWYAARCLGPGWQVRFHTALGADPLSDALAGFAEAAGIATADAPRVPDRAVGLYMIHLQDGERSFSYWRDSSAARRMMDDPALVADRIAAADVVYLSGITLAILPPDHAETLIELMARARQAGRIVAFDPNIRPRLWDDETRMRQVVEAAAGASSIALPSFDDEAATFGDADPEATAARYAARGCPHVVVKNGPRPVLTRIDGALHVHALPAPVERVVDSTAAGDSFNAAYLAAFMDSRDPAQAVAVGQPRAARTICGPGALVP